MQHFATPKGEYAPAALGQQCQPVQEATAPIAQQVRTGFGLCPDHLLTKDLLQEVEFIEARGWTLPYCCLNVRSNLRDMWYSMTF